MKTYEIKSCEGQKASFTIISTTKAGFKIKIMREKNGYETVTEDFLSKELFETCLRTGYIREIKTPAAVVVA